LAATAVTFTVGLALTAAYIRFVFATTAVYSLLDFTMSALVF